MSSILSFGNNTPYNSANHYTNRLQPSMKMSVSFGDSVILDKGEKPEIKVTNQSSFMPDYFPNQLKMKELKEFYKKIAPKDQGKIMDIIAKCEPMTDENREEIDAAINKAAKNLDPKKEKPEFEKLVHGLIEITSKLPDKDKQGIRKASQNASLNNKMNCLLGFSVLGLFYQMLLGPCNANEMTILNITAASALTVFIMGTLGLFVSDNKKVRYIADTIAF